MLNPNRFRKIAFNRNIFNKNNINIRKNTCDANNNKHSIDEFITVFTYNKYHKKFVEYGIIFGTSCGIAVGCNINYKAIKTVWKDGMNSSALSIPIICPLVLIMCTFFGGVGGFISSMGLPFLALSCIVGSGVEKICDIIN